MVFKYLPSCIESNCCTCSPSHKIAVICKDSVCVRAISNKDNLIGVFLLENLAVSVPVLTDKWIVAKSSPHFLPQANSMGEQHHNRQEASRFLGKVKAFVP